MSELASSIPSSSPQTRPSWLSRRLRAAVLDKLRELEGGRIDLVEADGAPVVLGGGAESGPPSAFPARPRSGVLVAARDFRLGSGLPKRTWMGSGTARISSRWSVSCSGIGAVDALDSGSARLRGWLLRALHALRRNTRKGAERNIAAHYDLGNDFFRLFLDREYLMYSCAMFAQPGETLEAAQRRRLDAVCRKLELAPGDRVIEIGSGWGGFACYAAEHYGCHVTTTTISRQQYEYCRRLIAERGLEGRVEVLFADYRELEGRYDKLVSLEMIEAIGHQYLPTYFAKVAELLAPHGMALIQAITIEERRYEQARRSVDFIKRYIFPGSFIPAVAPMMAAIARASDLKLFHLEDIGPSYALTLREWHRRFLAAEEEVAALGFDRRFRRMWRFYLAYCEGGFAERVLGDVQMLLVKPGCRRSPLLSAA